jgi:hypothetical protein
VRMAQFKEEEIASMGQRSAEKIAEYSPKNFGLQIASIADAQSRRLAERAKPSDSRPEAAA